MVPHPHKVGELAYEKPGPGYNTPADAVKYGKREHILYIPCISILPVKSDYVSVVDVKPGSETFSKVSEMLYKNWWILHLIFHA